MSDDKRAAFEAWYSNSGKWPQAFRRSGESYVYAECAHAWTVWQAAAAYERQRCADFVPLYTADQMREVIAAERDRSHELLQAADHIRAGLEAELAALSAALAEKEQPK